MPWLQPPALSQGGFLAAPGLSFSLTSGSCSALSICVASKQAKDNTASPLGVGASAPSTIPWVDNFERLPKLLLRWDQAPAAHSGEEFRKTPLICFHSLHFTLSQSPSAVPWELLQISCLHTSFCFSKTLIMRSMISSGQFFQEEVEFSCECYYGLSVGDPQIHMLKPNPPRDEVWRRGLWKVSRS